MSKEFSGLLLRVRLEITPTDDVRVPGALQHDALLRHVAVQTRDRQKGGVCYGPGSAAHHERARRRAQRAHAALRPGHTIDLLISERDLYAWATAQADLAHAMYRVLRRCPPYGAECVGWAKARLP